MSTYRWNQREVAEQYDHAAPLIHPHYTEIQTTVLDALPQDTSAEPRLVDLGGGSGRLVERFLDRWPRASAVVLDQSASFLALAERRLERFGPRARVLATRLEDDWTVDSPAGVDACVSMSAIHHLDAAQKQVLFARVHDVLSQRGVFVNGDECRADADETYLADLKRWVSHMNHLAASGRVSAAMTDTMQDWQARNIGGFGGPRTSGDDCHETVAAQLAYLRTAGFTAPECIWHKDLWAVVRATR